MCMVNVSATLISDSGGGIQGVRELQNALREGKYIAVG